MFESALVFGLPAPDDPEAAEVRDVDVLAGTAMDFDTLVWSVLRSRPSPVSASMLCGLDPAGLDRADLVTAAAATERAKRMLEGRLIRFEAAAAGPPSTLPGLDEAAEELSCALEMDPRTAAAEVAAARGIDGRLPRTLSRLDAGEISRRQAQQVEAATRELDPETAGKVEADAVPGDPRRLTCRRSRNSLLGGCVVHVIP